ncbi:hypothetical protein ABKN59_002256 [Abortiporus biennis]
MLPVVSLRSSVQKLKVPDSLAEQQRNTFGLSQI